MAKDDENKDAVELDKSPFPRGALINILQYSCEKYSSMGHKVLLAIYLQRIVGFSDDTSTLIFHCYSAIARGISIVGAMLCDNYLGKYKTIFIFLHIHAFGGILFTLANLPTLNVAMTELTLFALLFAAVGAGGLSPTISPFGGDQMKLPEQQHHLKTHFAGIYFASNVATLAAELSTPTIRAKVHCFGDLHCYALAFGVPNIVAILGILLFIAGTRWYIRKPASHDVILKTFMAIGHALVQKCRSSEKREHWLDHADDKYDKDLIKDVKVIIRLLVLYIPIPLFWAICEQNASRWVFQASRMNGDMGFFRILPEQMHMFHSVLVMVLIPVLTYVIDPVLKLIGIERSLQKIVLGGFIIGFSFLMAAAVEFNLEKTYPILPKEDNAQLRIFNSESCDYSVMTNIEGQEQFVLKALDVYTYKDIAVPDEKFELIYNMTSADAACPAVTTTPISIPEKTAYTIFLNSKNTTHPVVSFKDNVDKPKKGLPTLHVLANIEGEHKIIWKDAFDEIIYEDDVKMQKKRSFAVETFRMFIDEKEIIEINMELGSSYLLIVNGKDGAYRTELHLITEPNSVAILWQVPQNVVLATAEIFLQIEGPRFGYSQAPLSMKSVVQAIWLMEVALGHIIIVIAAGARFFRQSYEFILFSCLMFLDMLIFMLLARRYKPNDPNAVKEN